ncbi:MAG: alpha/beta hydrolase [Candidatus Woesebacteria bacterium]|nr:alpha/beta hydrolase [Candidatus Woesebacteria bacterium]
MIKKINFNNSKGDKLVGALHVSKKSMKKAVIIAHGFTSNKDRPRHIKLAQTLSNEGIAAFRIDFGGSGESSDRKITIKAEIDDLLSAINLLKEMDYSKVGVLGESLGGIVALEAYNSDIKAMVLWAPVTISRDKYKDLTDEQINDVKIKGFYIRNKDDRKFKIPNEYLEELKKINREQVLDKVNIPVMIVHGTADDLIPLKDSQEAINLLPKGSKLEVIDNWEHGDHKMDESMDIIIPKTVNWFKTHLK